MSQPIASQIALAPAAMDDTTSTFQDMDLDEPFHRSKRRRRGTTKPANPAVSSDLSGPTTSVPLIQSSNVLSPGITSFAPDALASNVFSDQVSLQIAGIKTQMSNMDGGQRALRSQLRELERFVYRAEQQSAPETTQRKFRSAKSVMIRVQLHPLPLLRPSATPNFRTNVADTRAKSLHQFCKPV